MSYLKKNTLDNQESMPFRQDHLSLLYLKNSDEVFP